jgi:hypothetical protein
MISIQPWKAYFRRCIAAELEEVGCVVREWIKVAQVREEL